MAVVTTERTLTASARIIAAAGASLASRGATVTLVSCRKSDAEREFDLRFPLLPRRAIGGRGTVGRIVALRSAFERIRPDAVLVNSERDMVAAALAIGSRGGVVRRLALGERAPHRWRTGAAMRRARCVLMGDDIGETVHEQAHVRAAIAWPTPVVTSPGASPALRLSPAALEPPPPMLAIVIGALAAASHRSAQHAAGAAALRAASRLVARHADLQIVLVGEPGAMQAMRVHAGSVGLADRIAMQPLDALLSPGAFGAAAVWVTAQGDEGGLAIVAAMMRRIPVVVPRGFDTEALVAPRITGFVADETDLSGSIASLAHAIADPGEHHSMGAAAAARAERLHGWDAFIDRTARALNRVAGSSTLPDAA